MGRDSAIEWTTHSWNGWRGCIRVSEGCRFCYAEAGSKRNPLVLGQWGADGHRTVAAESYWAQLAKWDRSAGKAGERHRVFSLSYGDFWEDWNGPMVDTQKRRLHVALSGKWRPEGMSPIEDSDWRPLTMMDVRSRALDVMLETEHLDFLLLTKRPENIPGMLAKMNCYPEFFAMNPKFWVGTSVEDRKSGVPRIGLLRQVPAVIRFLSVEPLLEDLGDLDLSGIHWVIVGGESGHNARSMDLRWVRKIRDQCVAQSVAFFCKQWGARPYDSFYFNDQRIHLKDSHGGDWDEWRDTALKIRQFPIPA